jgi:ATP-binding cassette subfamily B protein
LPSDLSRYRNEPVAFFARYVGRRPLAHAFIVFAVFGAVACSVGGQYGVKRLVDAMAQTPRSATAPWTAFALLAALIAGDNLLWRAAGWVASSAFVQVTGDLRSELFRHLTGHAPAYFADRPPGTLTSRITATSNAMFQIENMFVWNVFPPCATTLGAVAILATVDGRMTASLVLLSAVVMAVMFRWAAAGVPLHREFASKAAAVDGEMVDVVSNMPIVRAFGGIAREHTRFDGAVGLEMVARRVSLRYLEKLRFAHALVVVGAILIMLAWAIELWEAGRASAGDVVMVCTLGISVLSATRDLAVAGVEVTQHMARLGEALATLLSPHELLDLPDASALVAPAARVTIEDISFAYPGGKRVFSGLSADIPAGQRVGLIGPSGGGKTTLIALLQRLYPVERGRILIDGHDIAHATEDSLRKAIAVVPQETTLLNRSLSENIRYGRPEATDDEVWAAATAARCRPFIESLPEGLETMVGERGLKLSGGQRQRIAIARAFLQNAPLLIFDEATSSLDSESEEAIREAMESLMAGRTVITIAHRLSTLRNFDRILVLQAGRLTEDGAPAALMRAEGNYRHLVDQELSHLGRLAA